MDDETERRDLADDLRELAVQTAEIVDIVADPRFDPSVCLNCGGLIGCEWCPRAWVPPSSRIEQVDHVERGS